MINRNGILFASNLYESKAMNIAYANNKGEYEGKSFTHTPTTNINSCFAPCYVHLQDVNDNETMHLLLTVKWNGFDSSNTDGTFNIYWQEWQQTIDGTNNWHNTHMCNTMDQVKTLKDLVLSADSGTYKYDLTFNVGGNPSNYIWTTLRYRSDYSNGVGTITLSDFYVIPEKYYIPYTPPRKFCNNFFTNWRRFHGNRRTYRDLGQTLKRTLGLIPVSLKGGTVHEY